MSKIFIFFVAIELIHLFLYINIGLKKSSRYIEEFIDKSINLAISGQDYYIQLIPYDDLSIIYKMGISKNDFVNINSDKQCLEIYSIIDNLTFNSQSTSFYSTSGLKMGTYYEGLIVDDIKYSIKHDIDVKTNYFTFKPYISKWIITIEEISE